MIGTFIVLIFLAFLITYILLHVLKFRKRGVGVASDIGINILAFLFFSGVFLLILGLIFALLGLGILVWPILLLVCLGLYLLLFNLHLKHRVEKEDQKKLHIVIILLVLLLGAIGYISFTLPSSNAVKRIAMEKESGWEMIIPVEPKISYVSANQGFTAYLRDDNMSKRWSIEGLDMMDITGVSVREVYSNTWCSGIKVNDVEVDATNPAKISVQGPITITGACPEASRKSGDEFLLEFAINIRGDFGNHFFRGEETGTLAGIAE